MFGNNSPFNKEAHMRVIQPSPISNQFIFIGGARTSQTYADNNDFGKRCVMRKYSINGNLLDIYDFNFIDDIRIIVKGEDGFLYVYGNRNIGTGRIFKIDLNGNIIWIRNSNAGRMVFKNDKLYVRDNDDLKVYDLNGNHIIIDSGLASVTALDVSIDKNIIVTAGDQTSIMQIYDLNTLQRINNTTVFNSRAITNLNIDEDNDRIYIGHNRNLNTSITGYPINYPGLGMQPNPWIFSNSTANNIVLDSSGNNGYIRTSNGIYRCDFNPNADRIRLVGIPEPVNWLAATSDSSFKNHFTLNESLGELYCVGLSATWGSRLRVLNSSTLNSVFWREHGNILYAVDFI